MAYPSPIKVIGPLSQIDDMFDYFKGALLDNEKERLGKNLELWPYFYDPLFVDESFINSQFFPLPDLPFNRQKFYDWIDYWTFDESVAGVVNEFKTINGAKLYTFAEPQPGWTIRAVNDWGKIKSLELGIFGSVGNGGSLSSNSIIGSGSFYSRIPYMTRCSLTYLRYGLVRFESYGACHPEEAQTPAPTNPVVNTSARTFNWTNAAGFSELSNYEYYINGSGWITVTSKPISIPSNTHVPIGSLLVRTKGIGYTEPSDIIENDIAYISPIDLYIWVTINNSSSYTVYAAVIEPLPASLNIMGSVNIVLTPNMPQLYPFSIFLQSGQSYGTDHGFASSINTGSLANQVSSLGLVISPTTVDSRPININLNEQAPI